MPQALIRRVVCRGALRAPPFDVATFVVYAMAKGGRAQRAPTYDFVSLCFLRTACVTFRFLTQLFAQADELVDAISDLGFAAYSPGLIEPAAGKRLREAVHRRGLFFVVVRVLVAAPVTQI